MTKLNLIFLLIMFNIIFIFLLFTSSLSAFAAGGSIQGTVTFEGKAPRIKTLRMDGDAICLAKNKETVYAQTFVLGEGNTLGNVFVYVKKGPDSIYTLDYKSAPAVLDQKGCNYSPHVMGVMVGQKVKILNPDGTLHNVHGMCKINPEFNEAMPDMRKEMEKTFNKPEMMFPIRCDVHPWMSAWMAVMAHPFFVTTSKDGHFEIKGLPAGNYEIEAWHEKLGVKSATIMLADGDHQKLDFTFSAPN